MKVFFCYVRALMEAQDIFGLDFDFDEFEKYGRDDFSSEEDEDEYEEEDGEDGTLRQQKKKSTKKSIYEVRFARAFLVFKEHYFNVNLSNRKMYYYFCCPRRKIWKTQLVLIFCLEWD